MMIKCAYYGSKIVGNLFSCVFCSIVCKVLVGISLEVLVSSVASKVVQYVSCILS